MVATHEHCNFFTCAHSGSEVCDLPVRLIRLGSGGRPASDLYLFGSEAVIARMVYLFIVGKHKRTLRTAAENFEDQLEFVSAQMYVSKSTETISIGKCLVVSAGMSVSSTHTRSRHRAVYLVY